MNGASLVAIDAHSTITMWIVERTTRFVYRNLIVIHSESVSLGITVGKQSPLQHPIRRKTDPIYYVGRIERSLFHFCKVIIWIAVQFKISHIVQWIIALWPYLGQIKRIVSIGLGFFLRHDLNFHIPSRIISGFYRFIQISLMAFTVVSYDFCCFLVCQIFNALRGFHVKFHPKSFILLVDKAKRVTSKAVHMPIGFGDTSITHCDGYLVKRFG